MTSLVMWTPIGVLRMTSSASSRTRSIRASSGTVSNTSPMRAASSASKMRPVSISSWARPAPTSRGSSHDVPMSQADRPMRTKAALNLAEAAAIRMSDPSTKANPPPAAGPLTAAMIGLSSRRMCGIRLAICCCTASPCWTRPRPSWPGSWPKPRRSRPAQKPRPSPVRMTTRAERSAASSSSASCRPCTSGTFMAFNLSGRFNVIRRTPSVGVSITTSSAGTPPT